MTRFKALATAGLAVALLASSAASAAAADGSADGKDALDAAISLKIGSAMVGGLRLARLAEDVEAIIRSGCWDKGQSMLALIAELGRETVAQLRRSYLPAGHSAE